MSSIFRIIALGLILVLSGPGHAGQVANTTVTETGTGTSTTKQSVLSDSERARAQHWNLSGTEWLRYRVLMQGIRGSVSPDTLSPIEVLGIHARDAAERRRYAERWAQAMHEDATRILAFQQAYDVAIRRLYPNEPLIDPARLPAPAEQTGSLESNDRVLFFTRADCPACDAFLSQLLQRIDAIAGIDIYLIGESSGDDQTVRAWAQRHAIQPAWVRSGKVTLNHDAGALQQLTGGEGDVPVLMRRRGATVSPLRVSDI